MKTEIRTLNYLVFNEQRKTYGYSAADIERYYKKEMSAKEMHAMEKAALEDPFLADALEGYAAIFMGAENDLALLRQKINTRVNEKGGVRPLAGMFFPWLRVAALIIIVVGIGLLAYQFTSTHKNKSLTTVESTSDNKAVPAAIDTTVIEKRKESPKEQSLRTDTQKNIITIVSDNAEASDKVDDTIVKKSARKTDLQNDRSNLEEAATASSEQEEKTISTARTEARASQSTSNEIKRKATNEVTGSAEKTQLKSEPLKKEINTAISATQNNQPHLFRGQVTDENNIPLPFANITNTKDNVGTYADAKGYFTLISQEDSLNVQVLFVGYENINTLLQSNLASNAIVLRQDTKNIPSTVISNTKINTQRVSQSTILRKDPEPYDGWYNYNTYIVNNINIPDDIKQKDNFTDKVELSFDVNQYGKPINIKLEKSACTACDTEAIRLLQEGPKWNQKKTRKRVRLYITF